MRIAKADLVPTNERPSAGRLHHDWEVGDGLPRLEPHDQRHRASAVGRAARTDTGPRTAALHPIPDVPFDAAFGQTRSVTRDATISRRGPLTARPTPWSTNPSGSTSTGDTIGR